jgi:cellulose synthase (UDP-forming)
VTLLALVNGVFRYFNYPLEHDTLYITMAWEFVNLILLNAAIGALIESRQRRTRPRIDAGIGGELVCEGRPPMACRIYDLSNGGAQLVVNKATSGEITKNTPASLHVHNVALGKLTRLSLTIRNARALEDGSLVIGVMFLHSTEAEMAESVALVHGDSGRWVRLLQHRDKPLGILQSFGTLLVLGTRFAFVHFRIIFEMAFGAVANSARGVLRRLTLRERDRRDRRNRRQSLLANVMALLERRIELIGK